MNRFNANGARLLALGLLVGPLACVQPLAAQTTQEADAAVQPASSDPRIFDGFPKVPTDLPYLPFDNAWPARFGREGQAVQGVIAEIPVSPTMPSGFRTAGNILVMGRSADEMALVGDATPPADTDFRFEGFGAHLYRFSKPEKGGLFSRVQRNDAVMMLKFTSGRAVTDELGKHIDIERTWFAVYEPTPQADAPTLRGTALVSPGLMGTPIGALNELTTTLRNDGWLVVRMLAQPSRFTEQVTFNLDAEKDAAAQAEQLVKVMADRTAECAYATQAAMAYVEGKRPHLTSLPRIAVGFSGGAMTLPTIVARDPGRYAAAVLVGGGADFWLMNQRSNYRNLIDAVHENWTSGKPSDESLAALDLAYLRQSPLDSYHTAAVLKSTPVLMIQGTADLAVPSPLGDVLWERLGRPERWLNEGAGHEQLFMQLAHDYFPRMMDWLRTAVPAPQTTHDPVKAP